MEWAEGGDADPLHGEESVGFFYIATLQELDCLI
jgi:hypothetical protein